MGILITLTPEEERKLTELARALGTDLATHAHDVVTPYLKGADQQGAKSFTEILTPIRHQWQKSNMTDGEVDDLFEQELREARNQRRRSKETQ